jgi:hypothetical protein
LQLRVADNFHDSISLPVAQPSTMSLATSCTSRCDIALTARNQLAANSERGMFTARSRRLPRLKIRMRVGDANFAPP